MSSGAIAARKLDRRARGVRSHGDRDTRDLDVLDAGCIERGTLRATTISPPSSAARRAATTARRRRVRPATRRAPATAGGEGSRDARTGSDRVAAGPAPRGDATSSISPAGSTRAGNSIDAVAVAASGRDARRAPADERHSSSARGAPRSRPWIASAIAERRGGSSSTIGSESWRGGACAIGARRHRVRAGRRARAPPRAGRALARAPPVAADAPPRNVDAFVAAPASPAALDADVSVAARGATHVASRPAAHPRAPARRPRSARVDANAAKLALRKTRENNTSGPW